MKNTAPRFRLRVEQKYILVQAIVSLATILIAEGIAVLVGWIVPHPPFNQPNWLLHIALVAAYALPVALLLGAWIVGPIVRRLQHLLDVSAAWLHGNLSSRIADAQSDRLGLLSGQLDLLVAHLEQDEQDLDELKQRHARHTDQVCALAVDAERGRLARELHDGVKQHLFSLAMTASAIRARLDTPHPAPGGRPDDLAEMAREVETAATTAQRELTRLIENLRPPSVQEQGLEAALNDYTLLFGAREHILVHLDVQGDDTHLPPSVAEALYRVAQEALHNVARHARATRVDVRLHCTPEEAVLSIRDNGVGFRTDQVRRGLGLASMQERMLALSGRLTIESQAGVGTTVLAEVGLTRPLAPQVEDLDRGRPDPRIENWAWLGQKLVIPVGQTWPWLPADQRNLRRPLVEGLEDGLQVQPRNGLLGLKRGYVVYAQQAVSGLRDWQPALSLYVHHTKLGYEWQDEGASWALRAVGGPGNRMVLAHNGQPLAAVQAQGRLLNTWTEIVYDGRGYRLSSSKEWPEEWVLVDELGDELLLARGTASPQVELRRALPLPLLVLVAMCIVDEGSS
jgi:signal transduction histidine kinase